MKFKLLCNSAPHRRWIKFGLLTHCFDGDDVLKKPCVRNNRILNYLTMDLANFKSIKDNGDTFKSFIALDAANFLGKNYDRLTNALESDEISAVYVVGDLGVMNNLVPHLPKVRLLYNQKYSADLHEFYSVLHSMSYYEAAAYGVYPGFFYGCKDIASHPSKALSLMFSREKKVIFAGQDGRHSIYSLFLQHEEESLHKDKNLQFKVESVINRLLSDVESQPSVENAANLIVNGTMELSSILENTEYAKTQDLFKSQRKTVLFKSIFRLVMLRVLSLKGLLTIIDYPAEYLRIYNSNFYRQHLFIDFGGANGYECIYPRVADMVFNRLSFFQFDQDGMLSCQDNLLADGLAVYIDGQLHHMSSQGGLCV